MTSYRHYNLMFLGVSLVHSVASLFCWHETTPHSHKQLNGCVKTDWTLSYSLTAKKLNCVQCKPKQGPSFRGDIAVQRRSRFTASFHVLLRDSIQNKTW